MTFNKCIDRGQEAWVEQIVVTDQGHVLAFWRLLHARPAFHDRQGGRRTLQSNAGICQSLQPGPGFVSALVVEDRQFEVGIGLAQDAPDAVLDIRPSVPDGQEDAE